VITIGHRRQITYTAAEVQRVMGEAILAERARGDLERASAVEEAYSRGRIDGLLSPVTRG
jgi:hypothetical protein